MSKHPARGQARTAQSSAGFGCGRATAGPPTPPSPPGVCARARPRARDGAETGTHPQRTADGRGRAAPGRGEVRRPGARAPADERDQCPQQQGGRGAAQVQTEAQQQGARPRACRRSPTRDQAAQRQRGQGGHGRGSPPVPARAVRRPQPVRRARGSAAGVCGGRGTAADAAAVGGIAVHAAS